MTLASVWHRCVWSYGMWEIGMWQSCVCVSEVEAGGGRRRRSRPGVQNQKQELHTKLWGKRSFVFSCDHSENAEAELPMNATLLQLPAQITAPRACRTRWLITFWLWFPLMGVVKTYTTDSPHSSLHHSEFLPGDSPHTSPRPASSGKFTLPPRKPLNLANIVKQQSQLPSEVDILLFQTKGPGWKYRGWSCAPNFDLHNMVVYKM